MTVLNLYFREALQFTLYMANKMTFEDIKKHIRTKLLALEIMQELGLDKILFMYENKYLLDRINYN